MALARLHKEKEKEAYEVIISPLYCKPFHDFIWLRW